MITETFYRNRNNDNSLEILNNGSAMDISGLTRIQMIFGDVTYDSAYHTTVFDWTTNGASGQLDITIDPNDPALPKAGTYKARLILYDATYPNGITWSHFHAIVED
jgi:hypothetical protein